MRPMVGGVGKAMTEICVTFTSRYAFDLGIKENNGLERIVYPVHGCRQISKLDMVRNTGMPKIDVNPETFEVFVDGKHAYVEPGKKFALAQLYWFS